MPAHNYEQWWLYSFLILYDVMPVCFSQNCLHVTFQPYLSSVSYSRKYEKLPKYS